jgi:uncharacterized protein
MTTYLTPGVYVEEVDRGSKPIEGVGTAVAAFVGFTATEPTDDPDDPSPRLVTNWGQYTSLFGGFIEGALLPHAVYGYFNNGGGSCYIVRVPHAPAGDRDGEQRAELALPAARKPDLETLRIESLQEGALEVEIAPTGDTSDDPPPDGGSDEQHDEASPDDAAGSSPTSGEGSGDDKTFTLTVKRNGREVESFSDLSFSRGPRHVATVVNRDSRCIRVDAPPAPGVPAIDRLPAAGIHILESTPPTPTAVDSEDFTGDEQERTGISGLAIADDVTMVAVPDLVTAATGEDGQLDLDTYKAVQTALIDHCERTGSRMAILDAPPGMRAQQIAEWRSDVAMYDARFAVMYYPWLHVANPAAGGNGAPRHLLVPPCGHVAGVWARNDDSRGVWKAPANEVVRGVLDLELRLTRGEQDLLNPIGVNCIRAFGTRGIRIWGARTLSSDPSWRYVNVRRLFNFIEASIEQGTQWVVFEPNDLQLWQRVKRTINAFLIGLWRQGALMGATPEQAFYVKCDEETNPPESVDQGRLVVEIGVAPVKPAEFVIFRISQWQGGSAAAD